MENKEKEPLVSVVLPVYNAEQYLEECVESIIKQVYKNIEIIAVDDASLDKSKIIIKKYMQIDDRFILLEHKTNQGVSKSRNDALDCAKGDYIVFIDADDKVSPDFIHELLKGKGEKDICICGYVKFGEKKEEEFLLHQNEIDSNEKLMFHILCSNYIGGYLVNKLFDRKILKDIRFDEDLTIGEDLVFVIKYLEKCEEIVYISRPLYQYRMNQFSAMRSSLKSRKMNWDKLTSIKAAERVQILLKEKGAYIKNCCSYRVAKTSLWVLIQMIICKKSDSETFLKIKKNINENFEGYREIHYGGTLQYVALLMAKISPRMVWQVGVFSNFFFSRAFQTKIIH